MKKEITVPLLKVEDFIAANLRRDTYALKRDLLNNEFNESITARIRAAEKAKIKCDKCGKEFVAEKNSKDSLTCPKCR